MRTCHIVTYILVPHSSAKEVYVRSKIGETDVWLTHDGVWCNAIDSLSKHNCAFATRYAAYQTVLASVTLPAKIEFIDGNT